MGLIAEPLPQALLRKKGETERRWFLESELDAPLEFEACRTPSDVQLAYPWNDSAARERLSGRLQSLGITNHLKMETLALPSGPVETWVESVMDDVILRCVGKIAFNYLAFNMGPRFCMKDDFDAFRNYVRYGISPDVKAVVFSRNPRTMIGNEAVNSDGHTVLMDWNEGFLGIVCLVTLFGHLTYHCLLCSRYKGVCFPLARAHRFNLTTRSIARLC
jgi:hypothetical protein